MNVATILAEVMRMDSTTIAAGLLHDVAEDTTYTLDEIEEEFGPTIRLLVDGVTKNYRNERRKRLSQGCGRRNISQNVALNNKRPW